MYEHITQEQLLDDSLEMVKTNVDKREGSIIWDALSPHTIQLYELYLAMDGMLREMFGDTATREFLIRLARTRGIYPYPATHAILKGEFNTDVPIGSRFSLDELNYVVVEKIELGVFKVQCETAGEEGNKYFGNLIPVEYMEGVTSAAITELLIPGEDEEDTESLRQRYLDSYDARAYGGNRKDYMEKVHELQGVGGIKSFRVREGLYNVKLYVLDSTFKVPTPALIEALQTAIDPVTNQGEGDGIAPIGHTVLVLPVETDTIHINFPSVLFKNGYDWNAVEVDVIQVIDDYLLELKKTWESTDQLIIRIIQIESRLLDVEGIVDVQNTTINGAASNFILPTIQIPIRGDVTCMSP